MELSVVGRLALGSRTTARVAVLGASGTRLPARLLPLLNVRLEPASSALSVKSVQGLSVLRILGA